MLENLYSEIPDHLQEELFQTLLEQPAFRLERIISRGHATPEGEWYDQDRDEWILLLRGKAGLKIEGKEDVQILHPGDHLLLPAHLRHRVEWTEPDTETVWLALHFRSRPG